MRHGTRVQIADGTGTRSRKRGSVVKYHHIVEKESGRYNRFDPSREYCLRMDSGETIGMFKDRVIPLTQEEIESEIVQKIMEG